MGMGVVAGGDGERDRLSVEEELALGWAFSGEQRMMSVSRKFAKEQE
jgi:hypothetical protein